MIVEDRFWSKVDRSNPDGCWPWIGYRNAGGYGRFHWGRTQQVHRIAYELLVGPIPDGLDLDHLCRNRGCVNPAHLEPVTNRENILRGQTLPASEIMRTECPYGHPYTPENTYTNPRGQRHCRTCRRIERYLRRHPLDPATTEPKEPE